MSAGVAMLFRTRAESGDETRQLEDRLRLLKNFMVRVNSGEELETVIERGLQELHALAPGLRVSFFRVDAKNEIQVVRMPRAEGLKPIPEPARVLKVAPEALRMVEEREVIATDDVTIDPRFRAVREWFRGADIRAALAVRVPASGGPATFVSLASQKPREWSGHERALLQDLAEYLALAIRDAKAREAQRSVERHLVEGQKMEAVGRLVGGIAHDFNNLLTAMMIYCGLLATGLGKEHRLRRHVDEIKSAGERGAALVGQLLALTRQQVLQPRTLSLNQVLEEMREMLGRLLGEENVLRFELENELGLVKVDAVQMKQVVLNLALNARDAMAGGGNIRIKTANKRLSEREAAERPGLAAGAHVALSVEDSGSGIAAEVLPHIFEPFFTTKPVGQGSGLGLATAYGIVKQHGGYIEVASAPGQGAEFTIHLPRCEAASASRTARPKDDAGTTVLLVEDEELVRRSLMEIIRIHGFQVLEACDGPAALEISRQRPEAIDLMVTDLVMPGMTGRELAEQMALERPEMPVLYISGYTDDPRTRQLMGEGAAFLRKPFSPAALIRAMRNLLEGEAGPGLVAAEPVRKEGSA